MKAVLSFCSCQSNFVGCSISRRGMQTLKVNWGFTSVHFKLAWVRSRELYSVVKGCAKLESSGQVQSHGQ